MEKEPSPRKPGTIRCLQTEDIRPGTCDLKAIRETGGAFEAIHEERIKSSASSAAAAALEKRPF